MGDSHHHVLSHPIKEHNRRRSACHGQACLYVGQSVYSSASCRADQPSSTYLQNFQKHRRPELIFIGNACTLKYEHARTHMHQQLTLPKMKPSNLMATTNKNLKPNGSKGLHYHTYKSLSIHSTSKPSRTAH